MALPQNEIVFRGHVGKFEQKEGDGEETFKGRQALEYYIGNFKRDAYNGHANYFANSIKRGLWAYSGNFCSNSIEGYGAMSYGDATYFAGLFKDDKPFGPGVLTYANGKQDVGIWHGSQLYRLCTTVGYIEKLTNSSRDRLQVTKFKKLIAINEPPRDIATAILRSFGSSDDEIDPSILYSRFCKDPRSYLYDHNYFANELDDLKEVEESLKEEKFGVNQADTNTLATKFVNTKIVELKNNNSEEIQDFEDYNGKHHPTKSKFHQDIYILSWNNTPKVINVMKHSFKYRKQEETSDYDIGNILCGRRKLFRLRGPKETASIKVLEASGCNDALTILKLLNRHTLNIDLMDNKGNSIFLRAAANDANEVMQLLHLLGADIDAVNDEGFSPLTHTLSRYIALKYDVQNWSHGFLPRRLKNEDTEDYEEHWLEECMLSNYSVNQGSILSVMQQTTSKGKKNKKIGRGTFRVSRASRRYTSVYSLPTSEYIFELSPEPRIPQMKRESMVQEDQSEKKKKLEIIKNTAFYLLDIGSDIHVSVTPMPLMILAIFSGNLEIVEKLLKCGADANEVHNMNNGQMTALHIIAQARPLPMYPAMVNLFLRYGADSNVRTSVNYNMPEWEYLLEFVKLSHSVVPGLTPLQILAIRSDATYVTNKEYLEQICCLLSWFSNHNELFLGLSPLGLAISKGNNNIVSTMLNCSKIDVNATFDTFWGNPLFTYLRCHALKDDPIILDILRTLILKGVNPLEISYTNRGRGNALNFLLQLRDRKMTKWTKWTIYGLPQTSSNEYNLKNHEQILMELAKLYLRKYIRGLLIRLHLKFLNSMDAERDNYLRQMHYLNRRRQSSVTVESGLSAGVEKSDYGYAEICERTKEWMNSVEECKDIMEKAIDNMGDSCSPVQAIRLLSLLPNLIITPKKSEMKNLKITKFLEGKLLPDFRNCKIEDQFSLESQDDVENEEKEEENLKWIRHFVKVYNNGVYVYPEMEKKNSKYIVCYKCLKQSAIAQACPICRLVYFCSMRCNLADSRKPDPYHRCSLVFWNLKQGQFFALKKTPGSTEKLINKKPIEKKEKSDKKLKSVSEHSVISVVPSMDYNKEWPRRKKKQALSDDDFNWEKKKLRKSRDHKKFKSKRDKVKFRAAKRKGRGKSRMMKLSGPFSPQFRFGHASVSDEGSEFDFFGLMERDRIFDKISAKNNVEMAAKLLEKQSYLLEQKRLETERLKETQDSVDTNCLGEIAPPEEYWEKDDEHGEGKKQHTSQNRFMAFLKMLEHRYEGFDLEKYLPYIVFVDGVMYYKFYGTKTKYKENYSYN